MNQIQKKLAIINHSVSLSSYHKFNNDAYNLTEHLRTMIKESPDDMKLISSEYRDSYFNDPFEDSKSTRTYSGCIQADLKRDGKIVIVIWDGDMCDGHRTKIRSTFTFEGNWWKIKLVCEYVEKEFKYRATEVQRSIEEMEFQERCKMRERKLLEDFKEKQQ